MKRIDSEIYLETCAIGFATSGDDPETHASWRSVLYDAGLRYAAARGSLDAAEHAELVALRRFREAVAGLRVEIKAGKTDTGEAVDLALVVETINASEALLQP